MAGMADPRTTVRDAIERMTSRLRTTSGNARLETDALWFHTAETCVIPVSPRD